MAIAFRAALAGDSAAAASTTQAVTLPTGWQAGDFCVIGGRVGSSSGAWTDPAGWTVINTANYVTGGYSFAFYYRILQAGDTNPTLTFGTSSTWVWVSEAVFSSAGLALSFDAQGAAVAQNGKASSTAQVRSRLLQAPSTEADISALGALPAASRARADAPRYSPKEACC